MVACSCVRTAWRSHARVTDESHAGGRVARRYIAFRFFLGQNAIAHDRSGRPDDAPALRWTAPLGVMVPARLDSADRDAAEWRLDQLRETDEFRRHVLDQVEQRE